MHTSGIFFWLFINISKFYFINSSSFIHENFHYKILTSLRLGFTYALENQSLVFSSPLIQDENKSDLD